MLENLNLFNLALMIIPVLLALTGHEFAHAWAAHRLGDDTARQAGRLTLNPLAHLDVLGTIFLFVSQLFGWAKPVPIDPRNFRRPGRDLALVALAGPLLNLTLALIFGLALKIIFLAGFFPLLASSPTGAAILKLLYLIILINIALGFFNLLPLPPLDGFQVLATFLPPYWSYFLADRRYNLIFLIIFVILAYQGFFRHLFRFLEYYIIRIIFT
ncbi:MAG: site-2 protease family protein [Deltaproteobacteria bacterium]|nr:site-2 protease family protein [Deltaproteobacteria bacterium]